MVPPNPPNIDEGRLLSCGCHNQRLAKAKSDGIIHMMYLLRYMYMPIIIMVIIVPIQMVM